MNKMFNRIQAKLESQGKTKVWLARALNESTQNINNWKIRGVPAAKVLSIAHALSVTREYLEGANTIDRQHVASPQGIYPINKTSHNAINFIVFVDVKEQKVKKLLAPYLVTRDAMHCVYCSGWKNADPFLELSIWIDEDNQPYKVYLLLDCIIGITEYTDVLRG
jgi:hypothetical protein